MISTGALSSDMGWGDRDADAARPWGAAGSAMLLVAAGMYWGAVWVVSGLPPFAQLASLRRRNPTDNCAEEMRGRNS